MSTEDTASLVGKKMTTKRIKRRLEAITSMTDEKKAKTAYRRLSTSVLMAIAEGQFADPRKAAALVVQPLIATAD